MKENKLTLRPLCDKCGKVAPLNKEMTTENWIVYNTKENCDCGGKFYLHSI